MIIRRVAETTEQVAKMTASINEFFAEAKDRLKKATSYLPLVVDGVKSVANYLKEKDLGIKKKKTKKAK